MPAGLDQQAARVPTSYRWLPGQSSALSLPPSSNRRIQVNRVLRGSFFVEVNNRRC
ncbi:MAG: hypothetical protein KTR25_11605 [Myxococcales bacterium]|nr:hypothetical protein [Myxococcales bacterium]